MSEDTDITAEEAADFEGEMPEELELADTPDDADEAPETAEGERPRRRKRNEQPEMPTGYRASKRASKTAKRARAAQRTHEVKERVGAAADTAGRYAWLAGRTGVLTVVGVLVAALVLLGLASGVNGIARWWAKRQADHRASPEGRAEAARDNLLVIAEDGDKAHGFLAMRVNTEDDQVWGLAIPAAVFAEVPGRGFVRIGDSFKGGPDEAMVAVSNFLGVPFQQYVVVDKAVYQTAMERQSAAGLLGGDQDTNMSAEAAARLGGPMSSATGSKIGLAPLPVKPITLGEQEYLEAETEKVADLIQEWWGVRPATETAVRVIVYNGAGTPAIAGEAAKELVKAGFRVVGTGNADRFDYKKTVIAVHSGRLEDGEAVKTALGTGDVVEQSSEQEIADIIVIVGADYQPPAGDG